VRVAIVVYCKARDARGNLVRTSDMVMGTWREQVLQLERASSFFDFEVSIIIDPRWPQSELARQLAR
jgi:hypothetical protein